MALARFAADNESGSWKQPFSELSSFYLLDIPFLDRVVALSREAFSCPKFEINIWKLIVYGK